MSSHYSYDIDERNLRIKLKDSEMPFTEDIWLKFENYQLTHQKQQNINEVVKKFSFTLNRNVILPLVFGSVIIAFSLLLFNFINIKKKPVIANNNLTVTTNPLPKKPEIKPLVVIKKNSVDSIIKKDTVAIVQNTVIITPTVAIVTPSLTQKQPDIIVNTTAADNLWTIVEKGDIFESPNKSSNVIGSTRKKQSYTAIDETIYFIKVTFTNNDKQQTGYIRKSTATKNEKENAANTVQVKSTKNKKKNRKAENLDPINVPNSLSVGGEDKEPELR